VNQVIEGLNSNWLMIGLSAVFALLLCVSLFLLKGILNKLNFLTDLSAINGHNPQLLDVEGPQKEHNGAFAVSSENGTDHNIHEDKPKRNAMGSMAESGSSPNEEATENGQGRSIKGEEGKLPIEADVVAADLGLDPAQTPSPNEDTLVLSEKDSQSIMESRQADAQDEQVPSRENANSDKDAIAAENIGESGSPVSPKKAELLSSEPTDADNVVENHASHHEPATKQAQSDETNGSELKENPDPHIPTEADTLVSEPVIPDDKDQRAMIAYERALECKKLLSRLKDECRKENQILEDSQKSWEFWKNELLSLVNSLDDHLLYEFREVLEKPPYRLVSPSKIMLLALDKNENNNPGIVKGALEEIDKEVEDLDIASFSKKLGRFRNVQTRQMPSEFVLQDDGLELETRLFLKTYVDSLMLIYRKLSSKSHQKALGLSSWIVRHDPIYLNQFETILYEVATSCVLGENETLPYNEDRINEWVRDICIRADSAREKAEKIKSNYFNFLESVVLNMLNHLKTIRENYSKGISGLDADKAFLKSWHDIFSELIELMEAYLKKFARIEPITVQVGDEFDAEKFSATAPAEPTPGMAPNRIKHVEEDGYWHRWEDSVSVVMPVKVLVSG